MAAAALANMPVRTLACFASKLASKAADAWRLLAASLSLSNFNLDCISGAAAAGSLSLTPSMIDVLELAEFDAQGLTQDQGR